MEYEVTERKRKCNAISAHSKDWTWPDGIKEIDEIGRTKRIGQDVWVSISDEGRTR